MTLIKQILTAVSVLLTAGIIGIYFASQAYKAHASAPSGLPATVATTSQQALTTTASLVFATSTCAARVVSTTGTSGIMLGFSDKQGFVPTGNVGHWQPASTTVAYDSGQYGCGAVRIYSFVAQTITVSETI